MSGFILGEKKFQSQMFDEKGNMIPVTILHTTPCFVVNIRWSDSDGYTAVQLGFGKTKKNQKPTRGTLKKAGIPTPLRFLREIRIDVDEKNIKTIEKDGKKGIQIGEHELFAGTEIKPEMLFKAGDIVDVTGTSKGKGFQGVVKRHGFAGGPKTHGQSDRERAPGSIGSGTTPGRVYKGKKMAGRMGGERKTVKNLEVVESNGEILKIKGLIPGAIGGLIEVRTIHL
ncbi:50S ribosomal protein L3 [Candidatus Roizmanbacteria bacterium CG_4_9_14_0_2_um_filter_39_13]|uniref:Large ribosomal subunit protein uL3 n=2 Tax=Candidatus Roizmaniibacteriota TaxID=1752723 RepID=A0A2M8EXJ2_9BACT|nr:MAG: 50S ribosomal protein L3 [Candidatus Roizmanbacteria bacterium CG_4_10_14_0_2_um_filter_39_12]PJC30746.1 MAG: 50S ribosomal protein L3 [Candidatus Roizmanbacteria bacterium CG_4_9_14_0_2_um_filter_39_13]PJE62265.1 MAG: 50S ribosomal protein L3 [Candidatus Roizmanbacteria bacterium CG10_big_fil_rev_8_21_14_0_10_39_12]